MHTKIIGCFAICDGTVSIENLTIPELDSTAVSGFEHCLPQSVLVKGLDDAIHADPEGRVEEP